MEKREPFHFDPSDLDAMRKLMEQFGDSGQLFWGVNECEERVSFSFFHVQIITCTYQNNDWVRINTYPKMSA